MAKKKDLPYNIRKVNGQWVFTEDIFGAGFPAVPKPLLIVPENLIPETVYASNKTGYIPESQITSYFNSKSFSDLVAGLTTTSGRGIMPAVDPTSLPGGGRVNVSTSIRSISNAVNRTLSQVNEAENTAKFNAAKKADPKTGLKVNADNTPVSNFLTFIPNSDSYQRVSGNWDFGIRAAQSGKYSIDAANGVVASGDLQYLFLPDREGKLTESSTRMLQQFVDDTFKATTADIKQWQKLFGVPQDGMMSAELSKAIVDVAKQASLYNWNKASSGDTAGFKPLDPLSFLKKMQAEGGAGGGKGATTTTRTIRKFDQGDARYIVEQVYQNTVGRRPTDQEVKLYVDAFNQRARKAPSVSTTTQNAAGTARTTTGTSGFDDTEAAFMARTAIEQTPEAKWVTSSTTLYDAFLQAIRNPMG